MSVLKNLGATLGAALCIDGQSSVMSCSVPVLDSKSQLHCAACNCCQLRSKICEMFSETLYIGARALMYKSIGRCNSVCRDNGLRKRGLETAHFVSLIMSRS